MNTSLFDFIKKENKYRNITFDNLSFVEYRQYKNQVKNKVYTDKNLFIFVLKGKKIIEVENKFFEVSQNQAIFVPSGNYIMSEVLSEDSNSFESFVFFFDDSLLKEFFYNHNSNSTISIDCYDLFVINSSPFMKANIESFIPFFTYDSDNRLKSLKYKFFEILLEILNLDLENNFINFLNKLVNNDSFRLIKIMEDNFDKPYTIKDYSKMSNRSLSKFKKDFKIISNLTPKEWVNKKRIEKSITLMEKTNLNITQIAFNSGFESSSYFSRVFTKNLGCSPKDFQKRLKLKNQEP